MVARDPDYEWEEHAAHFSTFIGCQIDDRVEVLGPDLVLLQAQDVPLRDEDLARLRGWFREGSATHGWPGRHQYRFASDTARILIWDDPEYQADWFLASRSENALVEIASTVWSCGELAQSLWSHDERGEAVLARLRAR